MNELVSQKIPHFLACSLSLALTPSSTPSLTLIHRKLICAMNMFAIAVIM